MQALDSRLQDITMLWWLRQPQWLQQFKAGRDLLDWAINTMGVPPAQFASKEFQRLVSAEFDARGVRPVAPERVVAYWKKDTAKDMCLQEKWPKPYFPVMLQTRPGEGQKGSGAFIMFSSWQDAMLALREMAKTKRFHYAKGKTSYPAAMVYENQLADMDGYDFPCRIILDCDAKEAQFSGRYSLERLGEAISRVPEWFSRRLVEIRAIKPTDRVVVYEKEKSRKGKASRHYIFNIVGLSTWDTQAVLREIFWKELEKEKKAGEETLSPLLPHPWQVTDPVPHHGRGQYSVLGFFDTKKGETQCPAITLRMEILNGKLVGKPAAVKIAREDMTLEHPSALKLLHRACYTCPARDFVTMDPQFMMQRQVGTFHSGQACRETRTHAHPHDWWQAKKGPSAGASSAGPSAARNGGSPKSTFLPEWIQSAIARITGRAGGYDINTSMHCLDAIHGSLSKWVQGVKRKHVGHVNRALFCPCLACKGVIKVHERNGTFVAVAEDGATLYARCSDWTCQCDKKDLESGLMEIVAGSGTRPWIKLTVAKMEELESSAQQPPRKKARNQK